MGGVCEIGCHSQSLTMKFPQGPDWTSSSQCLTLPVTAFIRS
jgi:predicted CxxxxCH...CXXCH cytochrome family protein